jgi:hypothetical protein
MAQQARATPQPAPFARNRLTFYSDLSVSMAELAAWAPERIAAYFRGISQILRAVRGY